MKITQKILNLFPFLQLNENTESGLVAYKDRNVTVFDDSDIVVSGEEEDFGLTDPDAFMWLWENTPLLINRPVKSIELLMRFDRVCIVAVVPEGVPLAARYSQDPIIPIIVDNLLIENDDYVYLYADAVTKVQTWVTRKMDGIVDSVEAERSYMSSIKFYMEEIVNIVTKEDFLSEPEADYFKSWLKILLTNPGISLEYAKKIMSNKRNDEF